MLLECNILSMSTIMMTLGILLVLWWLMQDCDLVLRFYQLFGSSEEEALRGKVAWITGASGGIGSCLSLRWAFCGVKLVLSDRSEMALKELKTRCLLAASTTSVPLRDEDVLLLPGDVTKLEDHPKWLKQVLDHFGQLDVLVNNAGKALQGSFDVVTPDMDKLVFDVNVAAPVSLARTVLPYFKERRLRSSSSSSSSSSSLQQPAPAAVIHPRRSGHIVTTCSIVGKFPLARLSTYSASKAAVLSFFTALRMELMAAGNGITVTTICPGPIATGLLRNCGADKTFDIFVPNLPPFLNEMRPERCAELMSVAVANGLHEVWISSQPCMLNFYLQQYAPALCEWAFSRIALPILDRWAARYSPQQQQQHQ